MLEEVAGLHLKVVELSLSLSDYFLLSLEVLSLCLDVVACALVFALLLV